MALDPTYGAVPPLTDEDYANQLALIDAQLFGTPAPAPVVPPLAPPAVPVDTPLTPPRGANERLPAPPPPPPEPAPPAPQQVGFAPPGPIGAPDINAEVQAPPPAPAPTQPQPLDAQLAPQGPQSTGIGWLDEQLRARDAAPPPVPELTAEEQANELLANPNDAEELRFNLDRERTDILGRGSQDALRKFHEDETAARTEYAAATKRHNDQMAKVDAEAQALNNAEVDNDHWWSSRSTFQKIAAVFAALAGGFTAVRTGRNAPLEMIQHAIDQDIETQKANIANKRAVAADRRNALALAYERLGDMAQAEAAVRVASYDKAIAEAQTAAQQFDPRGTQALAYFDAITGLAQRRAAAWDEATQKSLDREIKLGEYNLKVSAENRELRKAAGGGGTGLDKAVFTPEQWAAVHPGNPVPPLPMNRKDYDAWLRGEKTGQELAKTKNEVIASARASGVSDEDRKRLIGDLTQPDGSPFLANGETTAIDKLKGRYEAAHTVARALDNVLALRTGWTSDYVKSPEWQRVKQEWTTAKGVAKDVLGLGALSGPDEALIESFLGGTDPTGVRDPSAGIRQARESVINLVRDNLKGAGYKDPGRFTIPNLADLKPREKTPGEEQLDANLRWQTNPYTIGDTAESITSYGGAHTPESIRADQRGFSDGQKIYAESLAKTLKDPNATSADKDTARARLKEIETKASSQGYRAFAKSLTAEKKFDILNPPAPHDADYQAFKDWYRAKYDRPYLDDREFPTIRPEGQ